MKLLLDNIIFSLQQTGGISVYWSELLKRMLDAELDLQFLEHARALRNIQRGTLNLPPQSIIRENALPPQLVRYLSVSHNIEPGTLFHSSYYRYVGRKDVINIVTVYDFIYELFRRGLPRFIHGTQKRRALQKADMVICISESTKRDLLHFFPEIAPAKLRVIPLAASHEFHRLAPGRCLSEGVSWLSGLDYVMYVGDRSSYKNFTLAVDVLNTFPELFFLIIGGKPLSRHERAFLDGSLGDRYRHLTALSAEQLNELYNHAYCLLYPSHYEGFGIPVLEAMQAGCPVIALRSSSIPEICGDAGLLADTSDVDAFSELVASLKTYSVREDVVLRGLARANRYSWDATFQQTLDCYREAMGRFADRQR